MDERKAAIERKHAMLSASFVGYKAADGTFVASARQSGLMATDIFAGTANESLERSANIQ
jgi:hypothetical protein